MIYKALDSKKKTVVRFSRFAYQKLFEDYIKDPNSLEDNVQLITRIFNYQKNLSESSDKGNLMKINQFSNLYKNILEPFCKNYFDLPEEYEGTNYPLTYVINIITHVTKHFIISSLYRVIIKVITKYLSETITSDNLLDKVDKVVEDSNYKLFNYIMIFAPLRLVKSALSKYNQYETDYDKEYSFDQFTLDINNILQTNSELGDVADKSSLIKNLNKYIYPFYKDWVELFVKEMKDVGDVYIRNILFQSKYIKIIELICK